MNSAEFKMNGVVGKIHRSESSVFIRLVTKDTYFNKKTKEWVRDENWFSIAFFGKKGDALERDVEVGERLMVEGSISTFPKEGPTARACFNAVVYHKLAPYSEAGSPKEPDLTETLEGAYDSEER